MAASTDAASSSAGGASRKRKAAAGSSSETEEELVLSVAMRSKAVAAETGSSSHPLDSEGSKKPKLASIFTRAKGATSSFSAGAERSEAAPSSASPSSTTKFTWHTPLGRHQSCLHGTFGDPFPSSKLALFDLDGTLVRPKTNTKFPSAKDEYDFRFCYPDVVARVRQAHADGFAIVVVSNQKQTPYSGKVRLETWRKKVAHVARALDVPLRIFAALAADSYRKPCLGIWEELCERFNGGVAPDLSESYYVGDAAGRKTGTVKDHSDTDYKWALNAGLRFHTPEQFFLGATESLTVPPRPWEARAESLDRLPIFGGPDGWEKEDQEIVSPNDTPLVAEGTGSEVVLLVGSPASGKSAFYERHMRPAGYVWVNQDTLGTRPKCLAKVAECIEQGKRCVVDNTNRDRATRKLYIDLACKTSTPVRCFIFDVAKQMCIHNNHFRTLTALPNQTKKPVPQLAIESFFKEVQPPKIEEGFAEPPKWIRWKFEGDEALRKRYELYYH
ncbi:DNA kinase/phosphatase Pnk1 [Thecaphora frezii]